MRTRSSICRRKVRYASAEEAMAAALAATIVLRPYRCDRCRHYHLTSRTKGKPLLPDTIHVTEQDGQNNNGR